VKAAAVVDAEVVELNRVRRSQPRRHLRFTMKTANKLFARRARRFLSNQFDGRGSRQKAVLSQPDLAHASRSPSGNESIAADGEGTVQQLFRDPRDRPGGEENGALEDRLELSDVSGPRVGLEPVQGLRRHAVDLFAELSRMLSDEVVHKGRNILPAILER